jgi:hypothetical protein
MLTGELRNQIDRIWDALQITYLLFLRRLDDLHALMERRIFPEGKDSKKYPSGAGPIRPLCLISPMPSPRGTL